VLEEGGVGEGSSGEARTLWMFVIVAVELMAGWRW